ncbi:4-aminobutyrate--2-oxoglutarate transaminase [Bordetella pseudohinzii]|uniref:4-aminobutyrate aminotransferase PuuE n=1 Tax=Bordetella pseudohinzii TaxID=1331258 RepID=A0A0J6BZN7_9BORD|nr:4-aminobutyrate--2-oxoglutarate transaminase [Bordetella pseudohinzii]ANY15708.1 4-aminobutyrate transaminase [Bordetella pseudohinzii]KMM23981.1 4-aminobutyrate aminotransferase [Bordetella pseudohinzii]KXA76343.1 4-aminobutyrate--2-oxoglutarate transaminase [Bordetella pseudohinzii]KXA77182.1 4-aminobutyrate--2-oxoglutarate transaminase [Bordetella pseudohinzii]CUJ16967.1 4-aminobutyrate aminotransferase PuuE [Bordetella pseudohinzii]
MNDQSDKPEDWNARRAAATPRGVGVMCSFYADRADNGEVWDLEGRRYIDFAGGIAVLNTGHRHPRVMDAVQAQMARFTHTAYQIVPYTSYVELAEQINARAPGDFRKKTALFTTGAEAVENAVKIARSATRRPGIIAFGSAFHGRTLLGMALTGKVVPYKLGFGPFPADIYHAPYPNALHGITSEDALAGIRALFKTVVDPRSVAAFIIEPVQGEGGFNICPPEFMRALRALCDDYGILLIADEVQTGFGRSGRIFAMEHYGVAPDLIVMAKSLAGGFPLSAVCGRAEVMDAPAPGGLGGTYAGHPLAVAAALEVLRVIDEEDLLARGRQLGERLAGKLRELAPEVPELAEVRALGAMVAAEFNQPGSHAPSPGFARRIQALALESGLLLLTCGAEGNVIRFLFPLTISDALMDEALDILGRALRGQPAP